MPKLIGYAASPFDRTEYERKVEARRVEFDGLPDALVTLPDGTKVDREILESFRINRYGK